MIDKYIDGCALIVFSKHWAECTGCTPVKTALAPAINGIALDWTIVADICL